MKILKRTAVIVLALTLLSSAVIPVMAAEESKTVRVAVLNYPNFLERGEEGTVSGYAAEYLSDIAEYTGWTYEYVDMEFEEALTKLSSGEIDLVAAAKKLPDQEKLYDFSESSMGENGTILCVNINDNRYAYEDTASFDGLRVGFWRIRPTLGFARIIWLKTIFR